MPYLAITIPSISDIAQKELKELTGHQAKELAPGYLLFESENILEVREKAQSIFTIIVYHGNGSFTALQDLLGQIGSYKLEIEGSFVVRCKRKGMHSFLSGDVEREAGKIFSSEKNKVDLKKPRQTIYIEINNQDFYWGLEIANNLWQRHYMARRHTQGVNSCVAYAMARLSGYMGDTTLLDPFGKDGSIAIEAARFRPGKILCLDNLFQNLKTCEINAKLANVKKGIQFSRYDVEAIDLKIEEKSVQHIVSSLPYSRHDVKACQKLYVQFFAQASLLLEKKGTIVILAIKPELLNPSPFQVAEKRQFSIGDMHYTIFVLRR